VTITGTGTGTGWSAGTAVPGGSALGGPGYGAAPWQAAAAGGAVRPGGAGVGGALQVPQGASPAAVQAGFANPRADAAAQSLAESNGFAASKNMQPPGGQSQTTATTVQGAQTAQAAQAVNTGATATAGTRADARDGGVSAAVAAGRSSAQAAASQPAVAQAQAALAQALGRTLAGQMTAGGAAVALAQAQWALRAARLGEGLAAGTAGLGAGTAAAGGAGRSTEPAARGARADGLATGQQGRPEGRGARPGQLAAGTGAQALGTPAGAGVREGRGTGKPLLAGEPTEMPQALAMALALAPKVRQRASQDRVERVERDTPRHAAPELEDEDFWDAWNDADEGSEGEPGEPGDSHSAEDVSREAAAQHYRALWVWLQANAQQALLRELEAGRCVLVLAPPDVSHMRLWGHVLRPSAQQPGLAAGAAGLAWPLVARWTATMPADTQWRVWRLRQDVDAAGRWRLGASRPDRHTPQLVVEGAAAEPAMAGPGAAERIALQEPRRLRRLLGTQWTLMALRVPVPLDGTGLGAAHAVHSG